MPAASVRIAIALTVVIAVALTARATLAEVPAALRADASVLALWLDLEPRNVPPSTPFDAVANVRAVIGVRRDRVIWLSPRMRFWAQQGSERVMLREVRDLGARTAAPAAPYQVIVSLYSPPRPGRWRITFEIDHDDEALERFQRGAWILPPIAALRAERPTSERIFVGHAESTSRELEWTSGAARCDQLPHGYLGYGPCESRPVCWP